MQFTNPAEAGAKVAASYRVSELVLRLFGLLVFKRNRGSDLKFQI
jgi:hypothetical protein